ncbi:SixA phosphatase family protein [Nonomuraea lactucae]|uniref:SixA phosphatase family protein n=1 Tax=Nonomuraea lactucae TaxID=2249762 RepID=UPI001F0600BD|nr:histidine phosphatase family protein [Nonomuraea lactucae]
MRTLIVLRHAKAAQVPGLVDKERPLTARGERDAGRAGDEVRSMGLAPGLLLCSPAVRTRRTAELAFPELQPSYEREIYQAYPDELLELVRRADPDVETVVLCGHNPGVHELAIGLAGGEYAFRPGSFAVIETESGWADLNPGEGRLVTLWDPKEH